jgi:hypothetical protein
LVQKAINGLFHVGQHCISPPQTPASKIQMLDYWFRLLFFGGEADSGCQLATIGNL